MTLVSIVLQVFGKINQAAKIAPGITAAVRASPTQNQVFYGAREVVFHRSLEPSTKTGTAALVPTEYLCLLLSARLLADVP